MSFSGLCDDVVTSRALVEALCTCEHELEGGTHRSVLGTQPYFPGSQTAEPTDARNPASWTDPVLQLESEP